MNKIQESFNKVKEESKDYVTQKVINRTKLLVDLLKGSPSFFFTMRNSIQIEYENCLEFEVFEDFIECYYEINNIEHELIIKNSRQVKQVIELINK